MKYLLIDTNFLNTDLFHTTKKEILMIVAMKIPDMKQAKL